MRGRTYIFLFIAGLTISTYTSPLGTRNSRRDVTTGIIGREEGFDFNAIPVAEINNNEEAGSLVPAATTGSNNGDKSKFGVNAAVRTQAATLKAKEAEEVESHSPTSTAFNDESRTRVGPKAAAQTPAGDQKINLIEEAGFLEPAATTRSNNGEKSKAGVNDANVDDFDSTDIHVYFKIL
ncbi:hypothetical protein K3495_g8049 [Podosphaera aphanis]|nr:hypothetical protein K3495_g8049 [Podosphaera aphanis]